MLACIHVDDTSLLPPEETSYWFHSVHFPRVWTSLGWVNPLNGLVQLEGKVEALIQFKGSRSLMFLPCHLPPFFSNNIGQFHGLGKLPRREHGYQPN